MDLRKPFWQWVWLIALAFIWGSSFFLIKKGLISYSPPQIAAYRMLFAAILVSPIAYKNIRKITRKNYIYLLEVAFIGNLIPSYLFAVGQTQVSSSLAGILNAITPIFTLIVGVSLFKSKVTFVNLIGLFLGLVGSGGLILKNGWQIDDDIAYTLLIVLAGIMYAFNLNTIKYLLQDIGGAALTAIAFVFTLPVTIGYLLIFGYEPVAHTEIASLSLLYIFILAFFSSALAVIGFNILVKYTSAIFAASVTYIIPVFAIIWGVFDGESVTLAQLLWLLVIVLGIHLVNKTKKKKPFG